MDRGHKALAKRVKEKSGFEQVYHKDCEHISYLIFQDTGEKISASTLKRFFGLVNSSVSPSNFTLDILARYTGFASFSAFKNQNGRPPKKSEEEKTGLSARQLQKAADTHLRDQFQGQSEPHKTIERKSVLKELYQFVGSGEYAVYPMIAPGGFGKTVTALQFALDLRKKSGGNELVLVTKASFLAPLLIQNAGPAACVKAICESSGCSTEDTAAVLADAGVRKTIIIDAVDEAGPYKKDVFSLFEALMQLCHQVGDYPECRVIFSQRTESWQSCSSNIRTQPDWSRWFHQPDAPLSGDEFITLPELTDNEIDELWHKLTGIADIQLSSLNTAQMRSPSHITLLSRTQSSKKYNYVEQDVVSTYLQHLMYDAPESTGNRAIFRQILDSFFQQDHKTYADLSELDHIITQYPRAWEELLGKNIIRVSDANPGSFIRKVHVRFSHQIYLECLTALFWYQANDISTNDLQEFHERHKEKSIYLGILGNLLWIFFRDHRQDLLLALLDLDLDLNTKKALARSTFYVWHSDTEWMKHMLPELAGHPVFRLLYFEHLVIIDELPGFYGMAIESYYEKSDSVQDKLFAQSIIALRGILELDMERLSAAIGKIKKLTVSDGDHEFPRVRASVYTALYEFLKGSDPEEFILQSEKITEATLANPAYERPQMIMHLHAFGLWLMGEKDRIRSLFERYSNRFPSAGSIWGNSYEARFFLSLAAILEDSGISTHNYEYEEIRNKTIMDRGEGLTSRCVFNLVAAFKEANKQNPDTALNRLEDVISTSKEKKYLLFEAAASILKARIEGNAEEEDRWRELAEKRGFGKISLFNN